MDNEKDKDNKEFNKLFDQYTELLTGKGDTHKKTAAKQRQEKPKIEGHKEQPQEKPKQIDDREQLRKDLSGKQEQQEPIQKQQPEKNIPGKGR